MLECCSQRGPAVPCWHRTEAPLPPLEPVGWDAVGRRREAGLMAGNKAIIRHNPALTGRQLMGNS